MGSTLSVGRVSIAKSLGRRQQKILGDAGDSEVNLLSQMDYLWAYLVRWIWKKVVSVLR